MKMTNLDTSRNTTEPAMQRAAAPSQANRTGQQVPQQKAKTRPTTHFASPTGAAR
ncbi:hypothetical protein OCL06_01640 [Alteromonas sp. ASW11-19]|uniref:Uncharacterized protein n=1 Tax=Alteromonas salexigens TaxID=2982530 RepID=A0ABT2VJK7_9ALTE|nr:hypothetical protein [Alteromonas salexigens]MCU7553294.1 hypothetical protein [Alteromonas salexigens]